MYLYYFKIGFRNILKNPGYAVINMAGLAIGMACSLLIILWVTHELSYDRFREHADDIYRVTQEVHFTDRTAKWAITQGPLGPALKNDFPEVVDFARFTFKELLLTYETKSFDEFVFLADGALFEMFSLPLIKGDPSSALTKPNSMVLSQTMAQKYFGSTDPIGKVVTTDHQHKFIVTGVLKKIPRNSVFHEMGVVIPFIFGRQLDGRQGHFPVHRWNSSSFHTLIQLQKGSSARKLTKKISFYLKTKPTIEKDSRLLLQPFTRIHLYSSYEYDVTTGNVDINMIIFFSIVAVCIMVIACINYMNLATARSTKRAREVGLRKILITFTFIFAIAMIICTVTVHNQLQYMQNKYLGYEKEHMVAFDIKGDLLPKFESVKRDLLLNDNILALTASSGVPGVWGFRFSHSLWHWDGQKPEEEILMRVEYVNADYFETFGMAIISGSAFPKENATDLTNAAIINAAAAKTMRLRLPLDKQISSGNQKFTIVGVVKDYHLRSLHQKIDPLILLYRPEVSRVMFARVSSENIDETVDYIKKIYKKWAPGYPFEYRLLDERVEDLYNSERRIGKTIGYFSVLTIIIACVGLFGLASFMAEQRTKEIGIRKAMGASVRQMVMMLIKEFARCIVVANIFAWPIVYLAMNDWLKDYAYRISLSPWSFIFAAVLTLAIGLLTVSYQAVKAAVASPVESLRYE